jgi:hypothetical protein
MAIELNHAHQGSRTSGTIGVHAKKNGKADDGVGATGFMALMMSMSSDDSSSSMIDLTTDVPAAQGGLTVQPSATLDGTIACPAPMAGALVLDPATKVVESASSLTDDTLVTNLAGASSFQGAAVKVLSTISLVGNALPDVPVALRSNAVALTGTPSATLPGTGEMLMTGAGEELASADNVSIGAAAQVKFMMPFDEISAKSQQAMGDTNIKLTAALKEAEPTTVHAALKVVPRESLVPEQHKLAAVKPPSAQEPLIDAVEKPRSILHVQSTGVFGRDVAAVVPARTSSTAALLPDVASALTTFIPATMPRPQERSNFKSGYGRAGDSGLDAGFGQAMSAVSRSDAVFVVPPSSATVADTAVAETVSYWVSHGVQNAEMTLDGFGESPVKVSILLQGDLAQIDFRTDQVAVRQVLEGASLQLKEMLSGQGLQLAGMSVGTSGQGGSGSGENKPGRAGVQRISMVQEESISTVSVRGTNSSVGQSLDLFV